MWTFKLALRNARRNVRRSLLTAATVVIGVALYVVFISFYDGVAAQMFDETTAFIGHGRIADSDYVKRESVRPLYEYLPDADAVVEMALATPGVTEAHAVIQTGVAMTAGEELGDVFGMAVGGTPEWFERVGLHDKIVEGGQPAAPGEWLLGSKLAEKAEAGIGDELVIFGQTQDGGLSPLLGTVVGIVHTGAAMTDRRVYLSLGEMQEMVDIGPGAIEVLIYTDDLMAASQIVSRIDGPALEGAVAQAWSDRAPYDAMVPLMGVVQGFLAGALIFLTALAIWNTMTMSVMERTAEIGVMRAMGQTRTGAVSMFVVEAATIALVGGVVGVLIAMGPSLYLEGTGLTFGESVASSMGESYAMQTTMYGDFTLAVVVKGLILGVTMAVVGSLIPSLRAATIQPVEAMRHGR